MVDLNSHRLLTTTLERILTPERERRKADQSSGAGFAVPAMGERPVEEDAPPILSTNMRGQFLSVKRGSEGTARYGFCEVLPEEEDNLLWHLVEKLLQEGRTESGLSEAIVGMKAKGLEPYHAVFPYEKIGEICDRDVSREEIDELMASQGHIAEVLGGVRVLAANVPMGFIVAHPNLSGFYTRSDDRLGIMLLRSDAAWCIVTE